MVHGGPALTHRLSALTSYQNTGMQYRTHSNTYISLYSLNTLSCDLNSSVAGEAEQKHLPFI